MVPTSGKERNESSQLQVVSPGYRTEGVGQKLQNQLMRHQTSALGQIDRTGHWTQGSVALPYI